MKTLSRLFGTLLLAALATGCTTYSKATLNWRQLPILSEPGPLDPDYHQSAVVSLPDAHYAGRHWTDLR